MCCKTRFFNPKGKSNYTLLSVTCSDSDNLECNLKMGFFDKGLLDIFADRGNLV